MDARQAKQEADLASCQICHRNTIGFRIALGGSIVTAIGAIAVATITVWSGHTRTAVEADMDRKISQGLVTIQEQLNRLSARLEDMDRHWRQEREFLERKVDGRPMRRDPDVVTDRPVARVPEPRPP